MRPSNSLRSTRRHTRGATLISLMVGLTISMLVVAAMMMVLRNMAHTTGEARRDAQVDDNLVAAMLSAGLTLHEAGFNIKDAAMGNQLIVVKEAAAAIAGEDKDNNKKQKLTGTLATATGNKYSGNLLIWTQDLGGGLQCSGLLAEPNGSLLRLTPQTCTDISAWESLNWETSVIARRTDPEKDSSPFKLTIDVMVQSKICAPFGITAPTGHLLVTLSALNSNSNKLTATECLGNFIDPTPASTPKA